VLREGRVEQVGTPMELYNDPANRFVAGFIGSPSMNFLPAELAGGPAALTLGIRPEHIRLGGEARLNGTVVHVEHLGGDTNVLVDAGTPEPLTVRIFGQYDISPDAKAALDWDDADSFLFDADGTRVRSGPRPETGPARAA